METLDQITARLSGFITDYSASVGQPVDLSPGSVLSELLIKLSAQLHEELLTAAEVPSSINTVQAALDSPEDTTSESIAAVASNYNVTRTESSPSGGVARVIVAFNRTYYLGSGFELVHPALSATFRTTRAYRAAADLDQAPEAGTLRLFSSGGTWYFLLPVQGLDGVHAAVPDGGALALNPANTTLDGFVEARAFGTFNAGRPVETDRELINRFRTGMSARGLLSPRSMHIQLVEEFPTLFDQGTADGQVLSMIGANHPELLRGKNTTYGITPLGLMDVYIRTSQTYTLGEFVVTARAAAAGSWQVVLDTSLPGFPTWFYLVERVTYVNAGGQTTQATVEDMLFGYDPASPNLLTGGNVPPEQVARFTKHQTCTLTLTLDAASTAGEERQVVVRVAYLPGIGDIQDYVLQSEHRIVAADTLVKAVIPCVASARMNLLRKPGVVVDVEALRQDIFNYANRLPFGEALAASPMVDLAHNYGIHRVDLPVRLTGSILLPVTGQGVPVRDLFDEDQLVIPYDPELQALGVSPLTTAFFLPYEGVLDQAGLVLNVS
jgi:hypothetical protein